MIAREEYPGGRAFEVVLADLLAETTDAIVNENPVSSRVTNHVTGLSASPVPLADRSSGATDSSIRTVRFAMAVAETT